MLDGGLVLDDGNVGILGATSFVGRCLVKLLNQSEKQVIAFSRQLITQSEEKVEWRQLDSDNSPQSPIEISDWVVTAPISILPDYFNLLESCGAKRVVALSSTSRFTKENSTDNVELQAVSKLIDGELRLQNWAEERGIDWIILRPTLIYGIGLDRNLCNIMSFIQRWGFFPILGSGGGLRQPVYVEDVASVCRSALFSKVSRNQAYNISGAEVITYDEMVNRIFVALGKKPRIVYLPRWGFQLAFLLVFFVPRVRNWSMAMADRMSIDMAFDYSDAEIDFGYSPQSFFLRAEDIPERKGK